MEEYTETPTTYNWLLIWKVDKKFQGWSKAKDIPNVGEPDKLEWVEWGKELPDDIEEKVYCYQDGELV